MLRAGQLRDALNGEGLEDTSQSRLTRTAGFGVRWGMLAVVYVLAVSWIYASGSSVDWPSVWPVVRPIAWLLVMTGALRIVSIKTRSLPLLHHVALVLQDVAGSAAQLLATGALLALLIHVAASLGAGYPLRDEALARADAMLGFDWDAMSAYLDTLPGVMGALVYVYTTSLAQAGAILLLGSMRRPGSYNRELFWIVAIGSLLTVTVFLFVPVVGKLGKLDSDLIKRLTEIRAGETAMTYDRTLSLISFPSFHTFTAVIIVYMSRWSRWCLVPALLINVVMLMAIPPVGGHYLVDVVAGVGVAVVSIAVVRMGFDARPRCQRSGRGPGGLA